MLINSAVVLYLGIIDFVMQMRKLNDFGMVDVF